MTEMKLPPRAGRDKNKIIPLEHWLISQLADVFFLASSCVRYLLRLLALKSFSFNWWKKVKMFESRFSSDYISIFKCSLSDKWQKEILALSNKNYYLRLLPQRLRLSKRHTSIYRLKVQWAIFWRSKDLLIPNKYVQSQQ